MCKREMALKEVRKCTPTMDTLAGSAGRRAACWESGRWRHSTHAFCLWCQTSYLALFFSCIDFIVWHCVHKAEEKPLSAHSWFLLLGTFSLIYLPSTASVQRGLFLINKHTVERLHCDLNILYFLFSNLKVLGIWQYLYELFNKWIKLERTTFWHF